MNKRNLRLEKYDISSKRYKELCGFCEQYPEWQDYLLLNANSLKSPKLSDMPSSPNVNGDETSNIAIKCCDYESKCNLIERVAKEASPEFWHYIIKSVCYEVSLRYLLAYEHMPLSKSAFYERRRYFFYLLDKEKKE